MMKSPMYKKEILKYLSFGFIAILAVVLVRSPWVIEALYLKHFFGTAMYEGTYAARMMYIPLEELFEECSGEIYAVAVMMRKQMSLYFPMVMLSYCICSLVGIIKWGHKKGMIGALVLFIISWILLAIRGSFLIYVLSWSAMSFFSLPAAIMLTVVMILFCLVLGTIIDKI